CRPCLSLQDRAGDSQSCKAIAFSLYLDTDAQIVWPSQVIKVGAFSDQYYLILFAAEHIPEPRCLVFHSTQIALPIVLREEFPKLELLIRYYFCLPVTQLSRFLVASPPGSQ